MVSSSKQSGKIELDERIYLSKPVLNVSESLMTLKRVAIASPSGNVTAVVFDKLLDLDRKTLQELMERSWKVRHPNEPEIEQCCFVTLPENSEAVARVQMFGGEFCGNAARSVIWLITDKKDYEGFIEVSGVSRPLAFIVKSGIVSVEMPLPKKFLSRKRSKRRRAGVP